MSSSPPTNRLRHLPGLDGLRALAVVLVLLFHNGFTWMEGGFLGVSVFFTLSGYLITSLLLGEHDRSGGVSLRTFWTRRFRRLLPASLLAIALAIAFGLFAADPTQRAELGGDVVASLAYVANWWFLASDQTYAALFSEPSPLLHFWSLAIEEQFYLLLPLAAFAAIGRRRLFTIGVVVALAATVAIPFVTTASDDWLYYATPARLPELLTGVLLALALHQRDLRQRLTSSTAVILPTIGGLGALAATLWLAATSTVASPWLYQGGFAAFSLVSVTLIATTHTPRSLTTRALALPPLQHLGRISYGVYLYHWPIFLWLDPARTGLDGWTLFALRMVVTLTLAELSYRFIEMPIRHTGRLPLHSARPRLSQLAPVAIAVVLIGGILTSVTSPPKAIDFDLAANKLASTDEAARRSPLPEFLIGEPPDAQSVLAALPAIPPTPRVATFGDSTALMTVFGLGAAIDEGSADLIYTEGLVRLACGVSFGGQRLLRDGEIDSVPRRCRTWPLEWSQKARAHRPDIALVLVGPWDVMTRQVTPDGPFVQPGDPAWDQAVLDELLHAVDQFSASGVYTFWLTAPLPNRNLDASSHFAGPDNVDPARFTHLNTLILRLPELRPGAVEVIDLAGWHASRPDDEALRPDGLHVSFPGGAIVAQEYLAPTINARFDAAWRAGTIPQIVAQSIVANRQRPDPTGPSANEPLRVAVWSDERLPAVVAKLSEGAAAAGIPVDVRTLGDQSCGVARVGERRTGDRVLPLDRSCQLRTRIAEDLALFSPHLVVIAPGLHEATEHRPWDDWDAWKPPGDSFIDAWLLREYGTAVDLAGRNGALVALSDLMPDEGGPYTSMINDVLQEVSMAPDRASWLATLPADGAVSWAVSRLAQPSR